MAKSILGALTLALLPSALAFSNTSPFFLFSTSDLLAGNDDAFARSSDVVEQTLQSLKECPSDTYLVVQQPSVSSADYLDKASAPQIASWPATNEHMRTARAIQEVVGEIEMGEVAERLREMCGAVRASVDLSDLFALEKVRQAGDSPRVIEVLLAAPEGGRHAAALKENDAILEQILYKLTKYTIIYTTTPSAELPQAPSSHHNPAEYEMETPFHAAPVHNMELKRDTTFTTQKSNGTEEGGLFERYQYFTPGLFMGLSAMIPLVLILGFGLNALANLEVSYFAFSKEMGPANVKKQ